MSEEIYLGISLGFNSSACVISNERGILAAISQERLNGQKNTKELPLDAIKKCLEIAKVNEISQVAISHYETITFEYFNKYMPKGFNLVSDWELFLLNYIINDCNITVKNPHIQVVNHHVAHALSTFGFYPEINGDYYLITSDGFGEGISGRIYRNKGGIISEIPLKNSIALVYQFVTGALGFKMHQHEGKITGLAAYGKPIYVKNFEDLFNITNEGNSLDFKDDLYWLTEDELEQVAKSAIVDFDKFLKLKNAVFGLVDVLTISRNAKREDIAASVQEFAEKYTLKWVDRYCDKKLPAYIAGGLFANVKINQKLKESGHFSEVYVCPPMGDEGTCVGATIGLMNHRDRFEAVLPQSCGTSVGYKNEYEIAVDYLDKHNLKDKYSVKVSDEIIEDISERLSNNKIVCLMRSNMEFGPRALCHRSILYNCDTKETNDWLNKKLSRTEFMPFAPVCRDEVADDLFKNLDGGRYSARFMTMTFDCTEEFAKNYPAACHIDNTARPQIIRSEDDSFMWLILREYERKTGKKALINTSFNLHNWPIIENELVGIESWITSDTDCLVIGNMIIEKK